MDTSLIINATNSGKKVTKAITNINPDKDNAILKTFAQKVNALTTNSYVDATRVDKMSVNEEGGSSGGGGLLNPNLRWETGSGLVWDGDGILYDTSGNTVDRPNQTANYLLESDGTYARDWYIGSSDMPDDPTPVDP